MYKKKSALSTSKQYRQALRQSIQDLYSVLSTTSQLELTIREYVGIRDAQLGLVNLINVLGLSRRKPLKPKSPKSLKFLERGSKSTTKKQRSVYGTPHVEGAANIMLKKSSKRVNNFCPTDHLEDGRCTAVHCPNWTPPCKACQILTCENCPKCHWHKDFKHKLPNKIRKSLKKTSR